MSRCFCVCGLMVYIYEELAHHTNHLRLHESIGCLLAMLMVGCLTICFYCKLKTIFIVSIFMWILNHKFISFPFYLGFIAPIFFISSKIFPIELKFLSLIIYIMIKSPLLIYFTTSSILDTFWKQ